MGSVLLTSRNSQKYFYQCSFHFLPVLFRVSPKFKMDVYTSELSVSLFPYHLIGSVDNGLPLMKWDGIGSLFVRQALLQRRPCVQQKESGSSH